MFLIRQLPDGTFLKILLEFFLRIRLAKSPYKVFGKRGSETWRVSGQPSAYLHKLFHVRRTNRTGCRAVLAVRHGSRALQGLTELLPEPVWSKVKQRCARGKAFRGKHVHKTIS